MPFYHFLKPLDADTQIRDDIRFHGINIYPAAYGAEDEEDAAINEKIDVSYQNNH